jgi:hypothetical protein
MPANPVAMGKEKKRKKKEKKERERGALDR